MQDISKGLVYGQIKSTYQKYDGVDFSKRVFMFPGQGSAYEGMYKDLYQKNIFIQQRFETADKIAVENGYPEISSYITQKNLDEKKALYVRNLALYVLELSLFELALKKGIRPHLLTAHSFGEYAALTAAGIVSMNDMLKLICVRDRITNENKIDAGMFALRANLEEVKKLISGTPCEISNINSTQQIVISVPNNFTKELQALAKKQNIAAIKLSVAHPYHSTMMKQAVEKFEEYLKNNKPQLHPPVVPVLSSVTGEIIDKDNFNQDEIYKIIGQQMLKPVNYLAQIKKAHEKNYYNFIEIGPQKILTGFVKETLNNESIKTRSFNDIISKQEENQPVENEKTIVSKASGYIFKTFNKALSSVTGYEVESIKIKDRLQEDLGIDSIKKAEIILKVLQDMGVDGLSGGQSVVLSELSTVDDILNYFDREQRTHLGSDSKKKTIDPESFVPLKLDWLETQIEPYLKSLIRTTEVLQIRDSNFHLENKKLTTEIIDFYSKKGDRPKLIQLLFEPKIQLTADAILNKSAELNKWFIDFAFFWSKLKIPQPWCDQNIHFQFLYEEKNAELGHLVRSFIKSWSLEQGDLNCKIIQVENFNQQTLSELKYEIMSPTGSFIKYSNGKRYIQKYIKTELTQSSKPKKDSVYLIIGGHSGVGSRIVQSITSDANATIVLMGRRSEKDEVVQTSLKSLKDQSIKAEYVNCDVRNVSTLRASIKKLIETHHKIDLIINSSGVVISKTLDKISDEEIHQEIGIKLESVMNLAQLAEEFKLPHVINFSSVAGHFGNAGQAAYALGNSALDIISGIFDKKNGRRFQSVLWGAWENTGFTEGYLAKSYIDVAGLSYLPPKMGAQFLWNVVATSNSPSALTYLDDASLAVYKGVELDKKAVRQFFDLPQSPYVGNIFDLKGLNLQNLPYLRDHRLTGQPILAASNMMSIFVEYGFAVWGHIPDVVNFGAHNFIFVPEADSQVVLEVNRKSETEIDAKLKSTFLHSEGTICYPKKKQIEKIEVPKYKRTLINHFLKNAVIELDDSFDFKCKIMADEKERDIVVELELKDLPYSTEMPVFDRVYQLVEFACQSLALTTDWKTGQYSIPKMIGKFELFEDAKITDKVYSVHGGLTFDKKFSSGHTYIVNEDNEVVIKLSDVKFSFLNVKTDAEVARRFRFTDEKQS